MSGGVIVFDIGGTWFRSAVLRNGKLLHASRLPATSFVRHPDCGADDLQRLLVEYLVAQTQRLLGEHGAEPRAAIAMGAAIDANTGVIHGSGPLWGPASGRFDLLAELRRQAPHVAWSMCNDVTAALLAHVHAAGQRRHGRTALITLSSGIASRVYDHARGVVPVDPRHGVQGEIGHLRVRCEFGGRAISLPCDCGGDDHLAAFASGRGLDRLAATLAAANGRQVEGGAGVVAAARAGDAWSRAVVESAMAPLADLLAVMFTHDPELDPVLFVGGVAAGLGELLLEVLWARLERDGLYAITATEPEYFRDRLRLGWLGDDGGLFGCALATTCAAEATR